jgi:hypothetical protein
MRRIVESGALRDVGEYPNWANRFLELMRMPTYTEWINMKTGKYGSPTAVKAQALAVDTL